MSRVRGSNRPPNSQFESEPSALFLFSSTLVYVYDISYIMISYMIRYDRDPHTIHSAVLRYTVIVIVVVKYKIYILFYYTALCVSSIT